MGVDLLNINGLKELELQGPIVMVNLMRFRERSLDGDGSGWDAYLRYSALTVPMIKARGSPGAAFIDMMTSPDYENHCDPHRHNGCAEHAIICTEEAYSKFKPG